MNEQAPNGTVEDVATFLGVNKRTVWRWCADKKLERWKIGQRIVFNGERVIKFRASRTFKSDDPRSVYSAPEEKARQDWCEHIERRKRAESDPDRLILGERKSIFAALEQRLTALEKFVHREREEVA